MVGLIRAVMTVVVVSSLTHGCREQPRKDDAGMSGSPLDEIVVKQLRTPPVESVAVLDAIQRGSPPPVYGPGEEPAVDLARTWSNYILKPQYRPPSSVPFAAFVREGGGCDVVRTRYQVKTSGDPIRELRVELSRTSAVESIVVTAAPEEQSLACLERARRVSERVFATSAPLDLVEIGRAGPLVYGTPRGPKTRKFPLWEQDLRWWCGEDSVGFAFLTGDGSPTRQVIGWDPLMNTVWFNQYRN
jgi:hypothetical protein